MEETPSSASSSWKDCHCTACRESDDEDEHDDEHLSAHPLLGVAICDTCLEDYGNGEEWDRDTDGSDIYCRWCAHGGKLVVCDKCGTRAFCQKCVSKNFGADFLKDAVMGSPYWKCFVCEPGPLKKLRALFQVYKDAHKTSTPKTRCSIDLTAADEIPKQLVDVELNDAKNAGAGASASAADGSEPDVGDEPQPSESAGEEKEADETAKSKRKRLRSAGLNAHAVSPSDGVREGSEKRVRSRNAGKKTNSKVRVLRFSDMY